MTELLSVQALAKRLERNPSNVFRAIKRLKIQPSCQSGTYKFYSPETVDLLRQAMRSKNKPKAANQ